MTVATLWSYSWLQILGYLILTLSGTVDVAFAQCHSRPRGANHSSENYGGDSPQHSQTVDAAPVLTGGDGTATGSASPIIVPVRHHLSPTAAPTNSAPAPTTINTVTTVISPPATPPATPADGTTTHATSGAASAPLPSHDYFEPAPNASLPREEPIVPVSMEAPQRAADENRVYQPAVFSFEPAYNSNNPPMAR